jgi:hypothetical protein
MAGEVNYCWLLLEDGLDLVERAHHLLGIDLKVVALYLVHNHLVLKEGFQFFIRVYWNYFLSLYLCKRLSVDEGNIDF